MNNVYFLIHDLIESFEWDSTKDLSVKNQPLLDSVNSRLSDYCVSLNHNVPGRDKPAWFHFFALNLRDALVHAAKK